MSLDTNLSEFTAFDSDADHPHEECGVFGVWAPDRDVARLTYFGLRALQHRGQESAGIAVGDGGTVMVRKDLGLVSRVFSNADIEALPGQLAVGHVRYGTAGAKSWEASQPHLSTINEVIVALAHNGTLVNTDDLRRQLIELGVPFNSNSDSEVAVKLIGYFTQETHHLREGIRKTMELIRGGYAMALINENALYAFRDPHGVRPLVLGRLTSDEGVAAANAAAAASALPSDAASAEDLVGDEVLASTAGWVVASETCALDIIGAEYVRDIRPGEILRISAEGLVSEQGVPAAEKTAHCIFEQVYFARPDSIVDGKSMYACRYDMGRKLALECPVEADMVIGTPDSGLPSAEGYAFESGIPYGTGLIKNRYVARTFIEPTQELRAMGVRLKLNPLKDVIEGKRIVVVDDSIVRGTTMVQLVRMLRRGHRRAEPAHLGHQVGRGGLRVHRRRHAGVPLGRCAAGVRAQGRLLHRLLYGRVPGRDSRQLWPRQVHRGLRAARRGAHRSGDQGRAGREIPRPQLGRAQRGVMRNSARMGATCERDGSVLHIAFASWPVVQQCAAGFLPGCLARRGGLFAWLSHV